MSFFSLLYRLGIDDELHTCNSVISRMEKGQGAVKKGQGKTRGFFNKRALGLLVAIHTSTYSIMTFPTIIHLYEC